MPIYEYECKSCGKRIEALQGFNDPPLETCECGDEGELKKLVSAPAFQFKGDGWYVTDYARKNDGKDKKDGDKKEAKDAAPAKDASTKAKDTGSTKTEKVSSSGSGKSSSAASPAAD